MNVLNWSALGDGQSFAFDPRFDVLRFDQVALVAADIRGLTFSSPLAGSFSWTAGGGTVTLETAFASLTRTNATFASGGLFLVGDDAVDTVNDAGANLLVGSSRGDFFAGLGGDDTLDGGSGIDVAAYAGPLSGYSLSLSGGMLLVTDIDPANGHDGTDTLSDIEALIFDDIALTVASSGEFRVNAATDSRQAVPASAALPDGGFVVAWYDARSYFTDAAIRVQRYDVAGQALGDASVANSEVAAGFQTAVATFSDGGFVVAWTTREDSSGRSEVSARRYSPDGSPVGAEFVVNTSNAQPYSGQEVAALSDGGFVVTWQSFGQDGSGIFAQRYDAAGARAGGEFRISAIDLGNSTSADVAGLSGSGFVAAWTSGSGFASYVHVQRFDAGGAAQGPAVRVDTAFGGQTSPSVAALPDGGFVVAWSAHHTGVSKVLVQRFDSSGVQQGARVPFDETSLSGAQSDASVAALAGGGFTVAVTVDTGSVNGRGDIRVRSFDEGGRALGPAGTVNAFFVGDQAAPSATGLSDGSVLVAWQSDGQVSGQTGVYARAFDPLQDLRVTAGLRGDDGDNLLRWTHSDAASLEGGSGADTLAGGSGNDTLAGQAGNDRVDGGDGNDRVIQSDADGDDTLFGGQGLDTLDYSALTMPVQIDMVERRGAGGAGNDVFLDLFERVIGSPQADALVGVPAQAGGDGNDALTGGAGDDSLEGGAGSDTLSGKAGLDLLAGGDGDDLYVLDDLEDMGTRLLLIAEARPGGGATFSTFATDVDNATSWVLTNIGVGVSASAVVVRVDYQRSPLSFVGGGFFQFFAPPVTPVEISVGNAPFAAGLYALDENGNPGSASFQYIFGDRVAGTGTLHVLEFDRGDAAVGDRFNGRLSIDVRLDHPVHGALVAMVRHGVQSYLPDIVVEDPGGGTDTVRATVDYVLPANVERLEMADGALRGEGNALDNIITGNAANNVINGRAGNDSLSGGAGDDTLDGGGGADTLDGGEGEDFFQVDKLGVTVVDSGGTADFVRSSVDFILPADIEILQLVGGAINGIGSSQANMMLGNAHANTMLGGAGNDTIGGSDGNDTLYGDAGEDQLYGEDGDDVILGGDDYDLIFGGEGNDLVVGEGGGDIVFGQTGNDLIDGGAGTDVLFGQEDNDVIFGDAADDQIIGGAGNDTLMGERGGLSLTGGNDWIYGDTEVLSLAGGDDLINGGGGNDVIIGGGGTDVIDGGHGNDIVEGNAGTDILVGSAASVVGPETTGSDLFIFRAMTDAGDSIYGFDIRAGDNDGIDLRALFDALGYTGTTPRADGVLRVQQSGADARIEIDGDGAANGADFTTLLVLVDRQAVDIGDGYFLFQ